jgi:XRE family transcriptional regulator, regulator of sulfur utilization
MPMLQGTKASSHTEDERHTTSAEQSVGEAVRRLRTELRISVRALASKCGCSPSFISQVELGQASPSIASLDRIASGLGVSLGQFFLASECMVPAVVKASQRPMLQSAWSRSQIESLSPHTHGSRFEGFLVIMDPGGASGARLHARETELFAFVFEGDVCLQLEGRSHLLQQGDAITLLPGTLHRWDNTGTKAVHLLKVIVR